MLLINNLQESTKYILDIFLHILPIRDFPLYMYFGIVYSINEFTDSLFSDRLTVSAPLDSINFETKYFSLGMKHLSRALNLQTSKLPVSFLSE